VTNEMPPPPPPDNGPVKIERWTWTLCANANESAVELWRDDEHKLTIPLTPDQVEVLMDKPITLFGVLSGEPEEGDPDG
jgi:hypothetical protein